MIAHEPEAGGLFGEAYAGIFGATKANAYHQRLTGHTTPKKFADAVEEKALDTRDAISREQHPIIATKQPTLVHHSEVEPVPVRLKAVVYVRCMDTNVIIKILTRQGMHAVRSQRNGRGGIRRGTPQGSLHGDHAAFQTRLVAHLDIKTRQARV